MTEDIDGLRQRFERFVDRAGEHHRWTGAVRPDTGIGRLKVDGRHVPVPHIAWTLAVGPIPSGVKIKPCIVDPACVRVEHLRGPAGGSRASRPSRKGAGSMRQVGAGIWELSVTAGKYDDGRPRRHFRRVGARSRSQASKLLAAFAAEVHDLPAVTPRSVVEQTFNDAVRDYLDRHLGEEKGREPKTIEDYWRIHEKWFAPVLGRRHPREIESSHIDARFGAMRRAGLSRSRMNQARSLYAPFFRWAKASRLIDRNPMTDFRLPTSSYVSSERTPPEVDELCDLLNAALFVIPDVAPLLTLGAVTGMRRGELVAVQRKRVNWIDGTITIDTAIDAGRRVKRTKTRKERTIAVDDATLDMLRRHCDEMDGRAALADTDVLDDAYLFSNVIDCSKALPPDYVTKRVAVLTEAMVVASALERIAAFGDRTSVRPASNIVLGVRHDLFERRLREDTRDRVLGQQVALDEQLPTVDRRAAGEELLAIVGDGVRSGAITPRGARLIVLHRIYGMSTAEVAAAEGRDAATVRKYRNRAEAALVDVAVAVA